MGTAPGRNHRSGPACTEPLADADRRLRAYADSVAGQHDRGPRRAPGRREDAPEGGLAAANRGPRPGDAAAAIVAAPDAEFARLARRAAAWRRRRLLLRHGRRPRRRADLSQTFPRLRGARSGQRRRALAPRKHFVAEHRLWRRPVRADRPPAFDHRGCSPRVRRQAARPVHGSAGRAAPGHRRPLHSYVARQGARIRAGDDRSLEGGQAADGLGAEAV